MAQQQQNITLAAPGFHGVNTQDSPITQAEQFCATADNMVIDRYGRLGARKGYSLLTTVGASGLGSSSIKAMHEFVARDGTKVVLSAANNKVFSGTGTLTDITGGASISGDDWQICTLNDYAYFFQESNAPLAYEHSSTSLKAVTAVTGYAGTVPQGNCAISAWGRLWVAGVSNNKYTVYWSDLLAGYIWTGGSSGSLDITEVWPDNEDEIVAIASHNAYLLIFGRHNIVVYGSKNADGQLSDPASDLTLVDVVSGIGCAARNSIQSVGKDLLFLDYSGVRSFARVIQEKSLPIGDITQNVRRDIKDLVSGESGLIWSMFSPDEAFYLICFPTNMIVYCVDMRGYLESGAGRITTWSGVDYTAGLELQDGTVYFGNGEGVCEYTGYIDGADSFRARYYSNPLTFGQPSTIKIPKQIDVTLIGGEGSTVSLYWAYDYKSDYRSQSFTVGAGALAFYGESEYGEDEYASSSIRTRKVNVTGSGTSVTIGFESSINGSDVSIQEMNIQALLGRIV